MKKLVLVIPLVISLAGCIINPLIGGLYTGVQYHFGDHPQEKGEKRGESCVSNILGLIATGDASVREAMNKAQITKAKSIDYKMTNILGLYGEFCIIVTGD